MKQLTIDSEITAVQAMEGHRATEKTLAKFRRYYQLLEQVNFFNHPGIEEVSTNMLLDLYAIESKFRFLSFEENKGVEGDEELRKTASLISINATQSLHAV